MKNRLIILTCCIVLVSVKPCFSQSQGSNENVLRFFERNKIRAGYLNYKEILLVPRMAEVGMNLALVKVRLSTPPSATELETIRSWARTCQKYGIKFIPVINLWGSDERNWVRYKYGYTRKGIEYRNTPCPLEEKTFHQRVTSRFVLLAKLSLSESIAGVVLDTELYDTKLYAAGFSQYSQPCMCDYCFERFLAGRPVSEPLPIGRRESYLQKTKQIQEYSSFYRRQITDLARAAKEQVAKIRPDFLVGSSSIDWPYAFAVGLARGFSSAESPVLAFSQRTYRQGYGPFIKQAQSDFAKSGINARFIAGIKVSQFSPKYLAENYYYCSKDSLGYWIYDFGVTCGENNKPLLGKSEDYRSAIQTANKELDKFVLDPNYQSHLKVRQYYHTPPLIETGNFSLPKVGSVLYKKSARASGVRLRLRGKNTLIFQASAGEKVRFELSCVRIHDYRDSTAAVVVDSKRKKVRSLTMVPGQNEELELVVSRSDTYAMIIDSGRNAVDVGEGSSKYAIDAARQAWFITYAAPLYLWAPPGVSKGTIILLSDTPRESFQALFYDSHGTLIDKTIVSGEKKVTIKLGLNPNGRVIKLQPTKLPHSVLQDVTVRVEKGFSPYISPYEEGLLSSKPEKLAVE